MLKGGQGVRGPRDFLAWLSGADPKILAECPTERPTYVGLGSAILIGGALAGVSMTVALTTALKALPYQAALVGAAWGLAVVLLDRWLVLSYRRQDKWWKAVLVVTPRLLLALIFGLIISTPLVLQIFRPELDAKIAVIQRTDYVQQANQLNKRIEAAQARVSSSSQLALAQLSAIEHLQRQRNQAARRGQQAQVRQYDELISTATEQFQAATTARRAALSSAQKSLAADLKAQEMLQASSSNSGLLIRLEALDALASTSTTIYAARLILTLFFLVIECMPILIKVLLSLGPEGTYDKLLARENQMQLKIAEYKRQRRTQRLMTNVDRNIDDEIERVPATVNTATDPEVERRIAARVRDALLGDPLDAFDGLLVVQLLDLDGEPVGPERPFTLRAGKPYRVVAYLAQAEPLSAVAVESVAVNGPQRPAAVNFSVSALSDMAVLSPRLVQIRAPAEADSEHAEFSFVAPEISTPFALWVQLYQRDTLIQVARLELQPEEARMR
jgi:Domain of unknown function (DUF4407)